MLQLTISKFSKVRILLLIINQKIIEKATFYCSMTSTSTTQCFCNREVIPITISKTRPRPLPVSILLSLMKPPSCVSLTKQPNLITMKTHIWTPLRTRVLLSTSNHPSRLSLSAPSVKLCLSRSLRSRQSSRDRTTLWKTPQASPLFSSVSRNIGHWRGS